MVNVAKHQQFDAGFVEVLTCDLEGMPFGYRLVGARSGPQLVAAGTCSLASNVFDRIIRIPTLPWMRGSLVLIMLDELDQINDIVRRLSPLGPVDQIVMLPEKTDGASRDLAVRSNYFRVLRACAGLGMIAGRGVARNSALGEQR